MIKFNSQTIKSVTKATMSIFSLITTTADKSEEAVNNLGSAIVHTTGALDDLADNMHDATSMSKLDDHTQRRVDYLEKYKGTDIPPALQKLLDQAAAA